MAWIPRRSPRRPRLESTLASIAFALLAALIATPGATPAADGVADVTCGLRPISADGGGAPDGSMDPLDILDPCKGTIHPGARISTAFTDCTAGFLFYEDGGAADANGTDDTARVWYLSTAGHCFGWLNDCGGPDDHRTVAIEDIGTIGEMVFCETDGRVGNDLALIQIYADMEDLLSAGICGWGGPDGFTTEAGDEVHHYGHGLGYSKTHMTRMRTGVESKIEANHFTFMGNVDSGDSGSPVRLVSGEALGVATHANLDAFGVFAHSAPYAYGTTIPRALELTRAAGFELQLATAPTA